VRVTAALDRRAEVIRHREPAAVHSQPPVRTLWYMIPVPMWYG
jgi:hypothetical protein